jgi:hypothetical protein
MQHNLWRKTHDAAIEKRGVDERPSTDTQSNKSANDLGTRQHTTATATAERSSMPRSPVSAMGHEPHATTRRHIVQHHTGKSTPVDKQHYHVHQRYRHAPSILVEPDRGSYMRHAGEKRADGALAGAGTLSPPLNIETICDNNRRKVTMQSTTK